MSAIDDAQYQRVLAASALATKYATPINRESAHEILQKKLEASAEAPADDFGWKKDADDFEWRKGQTGRGRGTTSTSRRAPKPEKSVVTEVLESRIAQNVARQATRTVTQSIVRGIFGMLKGR